MPPLIRIKRHTGSDKHLRKARKKEKKEEKIEEEKRKSNNIEKNTVTSMTDQNLASRTNQGRGKSNLTPGEDEDDDDEEEGE